MKPIKAHYDGKVLVLDEPAELPVNQPLQLQVLAVDEAKPLASLARRLRELPHRGDSPGDGAAQHDHYLYGVPKRS